MANSNSVVDLPRLVATLSRADVAAVLAACASRLVEIGDEPKSEPAAEPDLLTAGELAARLHLPESWVRSRARSGGIPTVRAGRYYRFNERAVRSVIEMVKP